MNILNWFTSFFKPIIFTGVLPDRRPKSEKDNDPQHEEFVSAGAITTWVEKPQNTWKKFTKRDQSSSSSCVIQSCAKADGVTKFNQTGVFPVLSARRYNERSNYPEWGTAPYEGLQLNVKGFPLESLYPSQYMTEEQIDTIIPKSQEVINSQNDNAGGIPTQLPIDIDAIAEAMDEGYGVVGTFGFAYSEWTYMPVFNGGYPSVHHQIAFVDRTIYQTKKVVIIEDSALLSTAKDGQRIITEEYLNLRCRFAGYKRKPKVLPIPPKPIHIFTTDLYFGLRGNEVKLLQTRLVTEGFLLADCITGYFGSLTKGAVIAYQKAHQIQQTGYCGPITRKSLNQ